MMIQRHLLTAAIALAAFTSWGQPTSSATTTNQDAAVEPVLAKDSRLFEMRTYHAAPGKLAALEKRFREHTNQLFAKHGIEVIAFWVPMNKEGQYENTLIYIVATPDKAAHDKSWKEFGQDPEWKAAAKESEKDGRLVLKVDSTFMTATDFSLIK